VRRWETFTALSAVVLASVSELPIRSRLFFAFAAIVLIVIVFISRLRSAISGRKPPQHGFDAAARAERIREQRGERK